MSELYEFFSREAPSALRLQNIPYHPKIGVFERVLARGRETGERGEGQGEKRNGGRGERLTHFLGWEMKNEIRGPVNVANSLSNAIF